MTYYFLDTETNLTEIGHKTKVHNLKIGVCQHYERSGDYELIQKDQIVIREKSNFIEWLDGKLKSKSHAYLIAHNVVYDATILDLFRELPLVGFSLVSIYSKGQVCIIRWKRGSTKLTMLDNGNIFSGTLERWGRIFNIPKIEIDFNTCTGEELQIYCKRDVEIMVKSWQTWMKFIHENDCGGFRETVGSTAFNTWRHAHLKTEVYVHKTENVLKLEREAYHGGRVEAFHQGTLWTDHYYYLDVNSMYPFVMRNQPYPTGLQGYSKSLGLKRLITYLNRYAVIARCIVNVDKPAFISKVNGFAAYPLGRFETVLTTNEIILALQNGWIETLVEFSWYKQEKLFDSYIDKFYSLKKQYRDENNSGFEAICKLFMNTLYGKFGQTGLEQITIGQANHDEIWNLSVVNAQSGKRSHQTALGGSIFETFSSGESYHSIPSIAAHVTANARLYLYSLIEKAGHNNVYYCDTDSLIVNRMGYYNLESEIDENTLGKLKIETHSPWLIVNAPKDYEMSERKKIKGIRTNATQLDDNTFLQEQWVKLAGLIRQGFERGYTSKEITKHQRRIIHSGNVSETGKIEPFVLR